MEEKNKAWQTVSSKYLFRRPWLTVRCEDMLLPNGNHIPEYYILEYPDWVNTIAITKEGTLRRCVREGRCFATGIRPARIVGRNRVWQWELAGIYGSFG